MQTVKLTIEGSYYDSQIYSGSLYLWRNDGSIITLKWDDLINRIRSKVPERLHLAVQCAFQRSDYLYGDQWTLIFQDEEIKTIIKKKFTDLGAEDLEISQNDLQILKYKEQDNPFPFPHSDTEIYSSVLYVGASSGLMSAGCPRTKTKYSIDRVPIKLWDGPALGVKAGYSSLALAAGSEGLYQHFIHNKDYYPENHRSQPRQIMRDHSNSARWVYSSIFSSSYYNEGHLAEFIKRNEDNQQQSNRTDEFEEYKMREIVSSSQIFGHPIRNGKPTLTWGVHDKICFASEERVEVVKFKPYQDDLQQRFTPLGVVKIEDDLLGEIIEADSALFGYIVEGENGLLVISSTMEHFWLKGEPVNWRVFPRSKFYTNQLHVAYEEKLCIFSFNEDYFVDQRNKVVGIYKPIGIYKPKRISNRDFPQLDLSVSERQEKGFAIPEDIPF